MSENDGINEIFEHTLQVTTGILTEHARGAVERRAAAARAQSIVGPASSPVAGEQLAAVQNTVGAELAEVVKVAGLSSALPVAEAVLRAPDRAPRARRARGGAEPSIQREQSR